MLFGPWSQAHAYDPSDYMETRLNPILLEQIVLTYLGLGNSSPDIFFLHFQRWINIIRVVKSRLSVYGRIDVNARPICEKFVWIGIVSGYV